MANRHNPKLRFGMTLREAEDSSFQPSLANGPNGAVAAWAMLA